MSLLNSKINSLEAEIGDVASQVSAIRTTVAGGNAVVSVVGSDANDTRGFRLLDTNGNLRAITGTDPYQFVLNNNTLRLSGPPQIGANGDDATNGFRLMLNNVIKSIKGGAALLNLPRILEASQ